MADLSYIYNKAFSITGKLFKLEESLNIINSEEDDIMKNKYQNDYDKIIDEKEKLLSLKNHYDGLIAKAVKLNTLSEEETNEVLEYLDDEIADFTTNLSIDRFDILNTVNCIISDNPEMEIEEHLELMNLIICAFARTPYFYQARFYVKMTYTTMGLIEMTKENEYLFDIFEEVPSFYIRCHDSKNACKAYYDLANLSLQINDVYRAKNYIISAYKEMAYLQDKFYLSLEQLKPYEKYIDEINEAKNYVPYEERNPVENTIKYQEVFDAAMNDFLNNSSNLSKEELEKKKKECFKKYGVEL